MATKRKTVPPTPHPPSDVVGGLTRTRPVMVKFTDEEYAELEALAKFEQLSVSAVVRRAVRAAAKKVFEPSP